MLFSLVVPNTKNCHAVTPETVKSSILAVTGMQCIGCEAIIENTLAALPGIEQAKADFTKGRLQVSFDPRQTGLKQIAETLAAKGYSAHLPTAHQDAIITRLGYLLLWLTAIGLLLGAKALWRSVDLPTIDARAGDGLVLLVGAISGLHCIGMCGSFVIGYSSEDARSGRASWPSHVAYGVGKTLSYASLGALFGLAGSVLTITPKMAGISALLAGTFLVIYGMNLLGFWLKLRWLRLKQPAAMARFALSKKKQTKSPLFIGLFSGLLLACGPLQAMYVMAAGLGDPVQGARLLTLFGLGTLPALLSLGWLTRQLSRKAIHGFLKASGYILIIMGLMLANTGVKKALPGYDTRALLAHYAPDRMKPYLVEENKSAIEHCH